MSARPASRPRIAVIVGGGTLTALAEDPFEICDYGQAGSLDARGLIARCAGMADRFDLVPLDFPATPSFDMGLPQWRAICRLCDAALAADPGIAGFVLTHGTGSLEETAFFLSLVWDLPAPLVVTGAQRPASALGGDGYMNFFQAALTAGTAAARGFGVLVVAHGEIHLPVEVTKTSNLGLDAFRSPGLGPVGRIVGAAVDLRLQSALPPGPALPGWRDLAALPRVDMLCCHAGADACAAEAFIAAGAQGIVTVGFAPGYATGSQAERLGAWVRAGGIVVAASRGHGPVPRNSRNHGHGFIAAGPYLPAKARILLQMALRAGMDRPQISRMFEIGMGRAFDGES